MIEVLSGGLSLPGLGWPAPPDPVDPWGSEPPPTSFENFQSFGGAGVGPEEYQALDQRFLARWRAVLSGEVGWSDPELAALAEALGVSGPLRHDRRPMFAGGLVWQEALLDFAEDHVPDITPLAADRVLGPWADEAPPRALVAAAALALSFAPLMASGNSPAGARWEQDLPPPEEERAALRAAARAPPMLWALPEEAGAPWQPLLPLAPRSAPDGPVIGAAVPLPGVEVVRAVVGRLHPVGDGRWALTAGIGLGEIPAAAPLLRRLTLELWSLRRLERRVSWEDLLRRRGDVLYRSCAIGHWRGLDFGRR